MADSQSNVLSPTDAGTPTFGVIHVRTRLDTDFTVLSNSLAQLPGSAVTVGVGVYIASLPDGTRIGIDDLCQHFDEGEILISRALRVLEAAGHLVRRREQQPNGRFCTRTYFYDVPGGGTHPDPDGPPKPPNPTPPRPRARKATRAAATGGRTLAVVDTPAPVPPQHQPQPEPGQPQPQPQRPATLADIDPQVLAVLTSLRRVDPRLELSLPEAARIAPAIGQWLAAGVDRVRIVSLLTERLPDVFLGRPVAILAYRLRETPLPLLPSPTGRSLEETPAEDTAERQPLVHPIRNCDGCDRGFRAPESVERCRDCRSAEPLPTAC
ncbi:hypothetical protein [Streptomyces sp. NPDC047000]|uniref:hypothetical protein n=1 Tax=Streptomyces sp. NPDC047000 TaxID=3155474 RepID=UPI0033DAACE0